MTIHLFSSCPDGRAARSLRPRDSFGPGCAAPNSACTSPTASMLPTSTTVQPARDDHGDRPPQRLGVPYDESSGPASRHRRPDRRDRLARQSRHRDAARGKRQRAGAARFTADRVVALRRAPAAKSASSRSIATKDPRVAVVKGVRPGTERPTSSGFARQSGPKRTLIHTAGIIHPQLRIAGVFCRSTRSVGRRNLLDAFAATAWMSAGARSSSRRTRRSASWPRSQLGRVHRGEPVRSVHELRALEGSRWSRRFIAEVNAARPAGRGRDTAAVLLWYPSAASPGRVLPPDPRRSAFPIVGRRRSKRSMASTSTTSAMV